MTTVCPAFGPPAKRAMIAASLPSQSTILPLPSSPHCTPTSTRTAIALLPRALRIAPRPHRRFDPSQHFAPPLARDRGEREHFEPVRGGGDRLQPRRPLRA